ncbi:MAG: hypothetical protein JWO43_436, partial [Candidatus Adlerbacteria bacterium]|nr:hypothetical protein [Candidatus Adlerbacteria bacterium]
MSKKITLFAPVGALIVGAMSMIGMYAMADTTPAPATTTPTTASTATVSASTSTVDSQNQTDT